MTSGRWQLLQDLVNEALDLPAERRLEFLRPRCADPAMLKHVQGLIDSYEGCSGFFEAAVGKAAQSLLDPEAVSPGQRLGAFQLKAIIGKGGMGAVYSATRADDQYQQMVAVKVMRGGFAATAEAQARFRAERQILANLNHPNIARLLDGGVTPDGSPFLVMEFVEGLPIDRFCEENRLSVSDRLALFRQVCSAVQYAHQNLIVHRDIKPANILVTADGIPKLLDFGIAKLLDTDASAALMTRADQRLMTPEYASPEQIRGETITTAADVYTLGALLYELLTGERPFKLDRLTAAEVERVISSTEPPRPSTVNQDRKRAAVLGRKEIGPDLDNIVLMAMRKEPERRYPSAGELSEDIRRYLAGFPVRARKDTLRYRSSKFIRRHTLALAAAAAVLIMLVAAVIITRSAQLKAERRFAEVRQVANTLLFDFDDSIANLAGATQARKLLVSRALFFLDGLAKESGNDESIQEELATSYEKIAKIQYREDTAHLGDIKGSIASLDKAIAIREALARARPADTGRQLRLADVYDIDFFARKNLGDLSGAKKYLSLVIAIREKQLAANPGNKELQFELADAYKETGDVQRLTGEFLPAMQNGQRALALFKRLAQTEATYENQRQVAVSAVLVADVLDMSLDRAREAIPYDKEALDIWSRLAAAAPNDGVRARDVCIGHARYGRALLHSDDLPGAKREFAEWVALRERLAQIDPADFGNLRGLALAQRNLGEVQERLGEANLARASYQQSMLLRVRLLKKNESSSEAQDDAAYGYREMGRFLFTQADFAAAETYLLQAAGLWTPLHQKHPETLEYATRLGQTFLTLGQVASARGNWPEAKSSYGKALAIYQKLSTAGRLPVPDHDKPAWLAAQLEKMKKAGQT